MPNKSVVGGCSNVADAKQGISLHFIPFAGDERPEGEGDANCGLTLCDLNEQNGSQLQS